jgi:hypothetical protein
VFVEALKCLFASLPSGASGVFPFGASHVWNSATRLLNSEGGFMVLTCKAITFIAGLLHAMWTLGRDEPLLKRAVLCAWVF